MADHSRGSLRLLAAELRSDVAKIQRSVDEIGELGLAAMDASPEGRVRLYASAAILETFYTSVEKSLLRALRAFGWDSASASWHRDALEAAELEVPDVRPSIIEPETRIALERYLSFRHRFRNLYLFDLAVDLLRPLLNDAPTAAAAVCVDLERFAEFLLALESA